MIVSKQWSDMKWMYSATYIHTFSRICAAVSFDSIRSPAVAFNAIGVSLHFDCGMYFVASFNNGHKLSAP